MKKHPTTQGKAPSQGPASPLAALTAKVLDIQATQHIQGGDIRPGDIKHDTIIIPPLWP
jgi:hypothetical protein